MAGLYHTLNMGADALFASRQGVDTAGHNIANAQTEGFSRQRINLKQRIPSISRSVVMGNGVFVRNISRAHDKFLEKHLNETRQIKGQSEAFYHEMSGIEDIFSPELNAVQSDLIGNFFNSMRDMANFPDELTARTTVREAAQSMAFGFHRIDASLRRVQKDVNDKIYGEIEHLNTLVKGIADLNTSIRELEAGDGRSANDLRDQQDRMLAELNEKMKINYYRNDGDMLVVRGPDETLLVDRGHHSRFDVVMSTNAKKAGFWDIVVSPTESNLTREVSKYNTSGSLKAMFKIRDEVVDNLVDQNNELASAIAHQVNDIHRSGFGMGDYRFTTGRNFFNIDADPHFAAQTIAVTDQINQSTDAISAGTTPDSPGDNVIINDIVRLENDRSMANKNATFNDYYANMAGVLGLEVVRAKNVLEADELLHADLVSRKESVAGVSLDEEAANLLKWQANFTASSRVITTVDEMLETVLGLKR